MGIGSDVITRPNLQRVLAGAFGGPDAVFDLWSDSDKIVEVFRSHGVSAHHFSELRSGEGVSGNVVLIPVRADPDWSVNSQINEAWGGAHLAFGMGIKGAHIDFVGTDVRVESW